MDPEECTARLGSVAVGRLGLSLAALPVVVPVRFRLEDGDVLFHAAAGSALDAASSGTVLAFQADHFRSDGTGWSVLLQGISTPTPSPDTGAGAGAGAGPRAGLPERPLATAPGPLRLLRLRPATVSGLRWD